MAEMAKNGKLGENCDKFSPLLYYIFNPAGIASDSCSGDAGTNSNTADEVDLI